MPETKEVKARDLWPRQTIIEHRQLGSEVLAMERKVLRVNGPDEDDLMLIEFEEASYEGEATCYPAEADIEVVI